MRIGVNPEKHKSLLHHHYFHRVILVVHIPNLEEAYYKNAFEVLQTTLNSLISTIHLKSTAITVINNNCITEVSDYLSNLLVNNNIEKLVVYNTNQGKAYPLSTELKGVVEPYVTISDADVFFMNNWESEVFKIFNNFSKVGVVSPLPCPVNYKNVNTSYLVSQFFNIKLGKVVADVDFNLFKEGVNPPDKFFIGKKWSWKEKQYYLNKNNITAILGATHFVATFDSNVFKDIPLQKPDYLFKNGDETKYIEKFINWKGYGRLSTQKTFAYHMGNTVEDWCKRYDFSENKISERVIKKPKYNKPLFFIFNQMLFKIINFFFYKN